jgi:hypothetical protein
MNVLAGGIIAGAVIAAAGVGIASGINYAYSTHEKTCTVSGKEVVVTGNGEDVKHQMRVHTDDCGSFRVGDAALKGKFTSSDTYGKLKEGHRYTFKYYGHRSGWRSAFPNIIEATEVR